MTELESPPKLPRHYENALRFNRKKRGEGGTINRELKGKRREADGEEWLKSRGRRKP